jgi:arginyl-tRNA synthetase
MSLTGRVRASIGDALARLAATGELGESGTEAVLAATAWTLERPKRAEHGDLSTNAPMVLAKRVGKPPRVIAEALILALGTGDLVARAEIAGPGFVNLRLHPRALHAELREILAAGPAYGRLPSATRERINVEFVSANPTGPMHVGHARGAIFGDAVARLLEATGNRVAREYYINDFGNQVRIFAESVAAVAAHEPVPEGGYQGGYVEELARHLEKVDPESLRGDLGTLGRVCVTWMLRGIPGSDMLRGIKQTLADLDVVFDVWFSEESLHRWGQVAVALRQLEEGGFLVRKEGALFFVADGASAASPRRGQDEKREGTDDKDRVVQKSDGAYTYFASDIAYHADKVSRGYDRLVTILGAGHHGYVARVRNALVALGLPSERFEALLYQMVFILRDGKPVKASKRAGTIITAEEIVEEIDLAAGRKGAGRDALRFFFLSRSGNTNVDFDLDLAKKNSLDNPVFYVQYGHARLCSIAAKARAIGIEPRTTLTEAEWSMLTHPDELAITSRLAEFPAMVLGAAETREPHKVVFYVQELAQKFQSYFTRLKNEKDPILPMESTRAEAGWDRTWDHGKTAARLAWVEAIRIVYAASLTLLGIGAPERMDRPVSAEGTEADVLAE